MTKRLAYSMQMLEALIPLISALVALLYFIAGELEVGVGFLIVSALHEILYRLEYPKDKETK